MEGHRQWRLYERYTIPPSTMSTTPHTHLSLTSVRNQNQDYCAQGHKAAQLSVISLEEGEMYYVTWVPGSEKANNPRSNRYSMPDNLHGCRVSLQLVLLPLLLELISTKLHKSLVQLCCGFFVLFLDLGPNCTLLYICTWWVSCFQQIHMFLYSSSPHIFEL